MGTATYNIDEIFAVTTKYIDKEIPRIFENTTPLYNEIMKKKEYVDGGNRLTVALDFNPMGNIGYITGTSADLLDITTQQNLTPAELDWKFITTGFSVTLKDFNATADSKHAIVNLVTKKAENSLASTKQFLAAEFFASASSNPKALNGLADMFAASGTSYAGVLDTTLGNDASGDAKWLTKIDSSNAYVDYKAIEPMITYLKTKANGSGVDNKLDYMISNASTLSAFKQNQQLQQRFLPAKDLQVGFDGLLVDGVTWYADSFCQGSGSGTADNYLYLISSNSIKFMYKYGFDGKNSPTDVSGLRIPNQPLMTHQRAITGNLFMVDRRVNGVFKGLNPAAVRS